MVIHKSRLEKEKDALATKTASGVLADGPVPGYMQATASFKVRLKRLCIMQVSCSCLLQSGILSWLAAALLL